MSKSIASFSFPVVSFRSLATPGEDATHKDYYAIVDTRQLPDLSEWRQINVRDPKLTGAVPKKIAAGFQDNPDLFVFMNRGLVVSAEDVSFDNKSNIVTVTLKNRELHGLLDGGHSYNIIQENTTEDLEPPRYVKIEILTGFNHEDITNVVDARNTSNQVKDQSLFELEKKFEPLKLALKKQKYYKNIAFKEFETDDTGKPKSIDVRDIIAVMMCFDVDNFTSSKHPINAYRSKAEALKHFNKHPESFQKLYHLVPEFLTLYDSIWAALPELYSVASKNAGASMGRFGGLTGVTKYSGKRKLEFTNLSSEFGIPTGFIFPMLGAFRALLTNNNGKVNWMDGVEPLNLLHNRLGEHLAEILRNNALETQNPSKTGKSINLWNALYSSARQAALEIEVERLREQAAASH